MALRDLNTPTEQGALLSCVDRIHSQAQNSCICLQSLQSPVAVHPAKLASWRDDMTRLEKSVTVTQRQLLDD